MPAVDRRTSLRRRGHPPGAADDLVARLLVIAMAIRASGLAWSPEGGPPDRPWLDFLWELGELASHGNDIRLRLFGPTR